MASNLHPADLSYNRDVINHTQRRCIKAGGPRYMFQYLTVGESQATRSGAVESDGQLQRSGGSSGIFLCGGADFMGIIFRVQ